MQYDPPPPPAEIFKCFSHNIVDLPSNLLSKEVMITVVNEEFLFLACFLTNIAT